MNSSNRIFVAVASLLASLSFSAVACADESASPRLGPRPESRSPEPVERPDDEASVRIGPLLGLGFPRPIAIEMLVEIERVIGLGVEYGFMPATNLWGVETRFWGLAGDLRLFPFGGAFFMGARAGYQHLGAEVTLGAGGASTTQSAVAESWFINPRLGFLFVFESGVALGIDAGVQVPITASLDTTVPSGIVPQADASIARVANTLGNQATPTIDLLRLGFLF
ncbi:MAG: hypothetical protein KF819_35795 [Labilithrix sp.]|nr:hypothetical protein [Labilithrix sp.]